MPRLRVDTKRHLLQGTEPQYSTASQSEIIAGKPTVPASVKSDPVALAEWRRISRLLAERGTLSKGDGPSLELYCATYSQWIAARAEIKEHGLFVDSIACDNAGNPHTSRKQNIACKVEKQCLTAMRQLLSSFGLTSLNREKVKRTQTPIKQQVFPVGSVGWRLEQNKLEREEKEKENATTNA